MMPFISTPAITSPTPVQTSAVVGSPIESSVVRVPAAAISSTLNSGAIQNNARGSAPTRLSPLAQAAAQSSVNNGFYYFSENASLPSVQFSSPFMAQLLSQARSIGESESLVSLYANDNLPTIDPELMELFSKVKYLPSNASLPSPKPSNSFALGAQQVQQQPVTPPPPPPRPQVAPQVAATVQVQQTVAAVPQRVISTIQNSAGSSAQETSSAAPATTPAPAPRRASFSSLVRQTGVDAYVASFTRNVVHLGEHVSDEAAAA